MNGPGVAFECQYKEGMHTWEDGYILEVINPKTGDLLGEEQEGEIVLTNLIRSATPLLRYRTRDLSRVYKGTCKCGRTHRRISRITGRSDDMLIVKGVNFFPRQVEQALMQIPGVGSNYQIIMEEVDGVQDVRINVEANSNVTGYMVEKVLKESLGFSPKGDVFPIGGLPRQEGKAQRVFYKK
jgi:phenylacetate-CoA ligase